MTFKQAKEKLDKLANGEYHTLSYELTIFGSGKQQSECRVYINGYVGACGPRWSDAFRDLDRQMNAQEPETIPDIDDAELEASNDPQTATD